MRTRSGSRAYRCAFSIFPIMLEFIRSLLPSPDTITVGHVSASAEVDRSHGGRGPKTRTAPRRVRQRCCPLLVRYVVTRSMGKTPAGVAPGPTAATRLVSAGIYELAA